VFSAIKQIQEEVGSLHVNADIGCHTFGTLPPFNIGSSVLGYGLGLASSSGIGPLMGRRTVSIMGDGGFWHNGFTSGVVNAVYNQQDSVLVILKNGYTSATGTQAIPSSPSQPSAKPLTLDIEKALRGVGVEWIRTVPSYQVADMKTVLGPPMIRSEGGKLVGFVFVDTDRPIADYVAEAKSVVLREVKLPPGTRVAWVGQFKYFERAKERLGWVIPLTLAIVIVLLYLNTKSVAETAIVLLAVPFSLIGAVWLLYLLHYNISVAVWVGLIALAGLDAETGVVMLLYLKLAYGARRPSTFEELRETIVDGAAKRLRPKLMTVATMILGLVPVLWSTGTGADVMKRIAAPMVGGLVTSFLLELTVYPAVFAIWKKPQLRASES